MLDYKLISGDCHLVEHPDAFARVQKEYPERAPRIVENPQGMAPGLWFIIEGLKPMQVGYFAMGHVVDKPDGRQNIEMYQNSASFKESIKNFVEGYRFEDHREDWEPNAYAKALDVDNVEATILYASWARYNYAEDDPKFQRSILNSYNEWVMETFAVDHKKKIFPAPMISILDVDLAVKDMARYVKLGAKTLQVPTTILDGGRGRSRRADLGPRQRQPGPAPFPARGQQARLRSTPIRAQPRHRGQWRARHRLGVHQRPDVLGRLRPLSVAQGGGRRVPHGQCRPYLRNGQLPHGPPRDLRSRAHPLQAPADRVSGRQRLHHL
jgi:hypothetical protein